MGNRTLPIVVAILTAAVTLVSLPVHSRAEESFEDNIEGTFESARSTTKERKRLDKKVEALVQKLPFYKRPFARGELKNGTEPCEEIVFSFDDDEVTITCDDDKPAVAPRDGSPTEWSDREGNTYTLTQKVESDRIVQKFDGEDGSRTNVYRLEGEDTLVLEAKIASEQLPEPLTWQRKFERAD